MLYVLVPVLVHVLLDGSGHDSAEIDGTVERHATSAPTKQPVPAPRHSTRSSKTDFHLDLGDTTSCTPYSPKFKTKEPPQDEYSPEKSSPKSKIPVKVKKSIENERMMSKLATSAESDLHKTKKSDEVELTMDPLIIKSVGFTEHSEKLLDELSEKSLCEKEARQLEEDKEKSDSIKPEVSNETRTTTTIVDTRAKLLDSGKFEQTGETIKRIETVTMTTKEDERRETEFVRPDKFVTKEIETLENLPLGIDDTTHTTISKVQKSVTDEVVSTETVIKTVTTVRCIATESFGTGQTERIVRTVTSSGDYGDIPMPVVRQLQGHESLPFNIDQLSSKIIKSTSESEPWAHGSLADRSFLNDDKVEQWESQLSQDTSPGSDNGDIYTKNGSSRHYLNSDTDSDGSPQSRRSPCKRCTLGSSSGSDVALHEGAELSPLEDDQGTALTANLLSKQCTYPANQVTRET